MAVVMFPAWLLLKKIRKILEYREAFKSAMLCDSIMEMRNTKHRQLFQNFDL